jgi:hypothetical protein
MSAIDCHIKRLRKKFRTVDDSFDMIGAPYGFVTASRNFDGPNW